MRFRLLRRRLTISAPRMAVRSALPWPLRWVGIALVLGFCAAIALWAFEVGKSISGIDGHSQEELLRMRAEVQKLRAEQDKAQSINNTSASMLMAEKTAQERMIAQIKSLEAENRALRDDLGFFQRLLPISGSAAIAIRGLQAEVVGGTQLKWQVLLIQQGKNVPEFRGKLQMSMSGTLDGKPWTMEMGNGPEPLQFRQYRRAEGIVDLPAQAVVKNVSAKVVEGTTTRAVQNIKL